MTHYSPSSTLHYQRPITIITTFISISNCHTTLKICNCHTTLKITHYSPSSKLLYQRPITIITTFISISTCHTTLKMTSTKDFETSVTTNSPSKTVKFNPKMRKFTRMKSLCLLSKVKTITQKVNVAKLDLSLNP